MKKLLYLIIPIVLIGCDDGEIITNDFEFDGVSIQACPTNQFNGGFNYVFHKTDNTNPESLVLEFTSSSDLYLENATYGPFNLGGNNNFQYRKFDAAPGSDYYCNSVPPTNPRVTEILNATDGSFSVVVTSEEPDDDNDGIPTSQELNEDTDGDGIMNFLDSDDDGDNVPTSAEGVVIIDGVIDQTLSRNTDGVGPLDYLDNDDDGDGVLTIQEDLNRNLNPADDISGGSSNYRNPNATAAASPAIATYREHSIQRNLRMSFIFTDLVLENNTQELIYENFDFGNYITGPFTVIFTPDFP